MGEAPLTDRQRIVKGFVVWANVATAIPKPLLRRFPIRYSMMLLMLSTIALPFGLLVTAPLSVALAEPIQGPKGESCDKTGTTTVDGKEEGTGKKLKCTADYCVYTTLESSTAGIKKVVHTHYMNVRDCQAALGGRPNIQGVRPPIFPGQLAPPNEPQPGPTGVRAPVPVKPLVAATTSPSVTQIAASVNIPAFKSGSVAAECPAGTRVTGGGYTIGGYFSLNLINSSMIGNAWRVVASTSSGSNGQLTAYAICVSGLSGTTTQAGKQISIPAQTSQGNTVTCPSGTTVTGGGFSQNNVEVFLTEQNQNGWTTSGKSGKGSSGLLNTYAICYGPASLSTFSVLAQVVVAAKGEGQAAAECPAGSLVTGGGFAINPPGNGRVHTMLKIGNAWRAVLKNLPTGTSSALSVYATCMNLSPGPAGVRPTVAPGLKQP